MNPYSLQCATNTLKSSSCVISFNILQIQSDLNRFNRALISIRFRSRRTESCKYNHFRRFRKTKAKENEFAGPFPEAGFSGQASPGGQVLPGKALDKGKEKFLVPLYGQQKSRDDAEATSNPGARKGGALPAELGLGKDRTGDFREGTEDKIALVHQRMGYRQLRQVYTQFSP